jgi:hypothetical protein
MNRKVFHWLSVAAILVVTLLTTAQTAPASALCAQPREEGRWVNVNPNTRSITRLSVRFVCQDQILNGVPHPPGSPFYLHLYGKCHPTDCDWLERGATRSSGGWIRSTIDHGFAIRYVWVKWTAGDRLRVYIYTHFRDNRSDYTSDELFRRI